MSSEIADPATVDRISHLPHDILHVILSFLPDTAAAARTSVLCKHFRPLWPDQLSIRLAPSEDFISLLLRRHHDTVISDRNQHYGHALAGYVCAVDRCLSSLSFQRSLRSLDVCLVPSSARRWLRFVALRSVAHLRLSATTFLDVHVPNAIFSCTSLVSLELSSRGLRFTRNDIFAADSPAAFPLLADIKITGCHVSVESLSSLISVCPSLLSLAIVNVHSWHFHSAFPDSAVFPSITRLEIANSSIYDCTLASFLSKCPSLRRLSVRSCEDLTALELSSTTLSEVEVDCARLWPVKIHAPKLTSVSYRGDINKVFLKHARRLPRGDLRDDKYRTRLRWGRRSVHLSHISTDWEATKWFFMFMLPCRFLHLFEDPTELQCCVLWVTAPVVNGLSYMLRHCPNIQKLTIDLSCGIRQSVMHFIKQLLCPGRTKCEENHDLIEKFKQEYKDDKKREICDLSKLIGNPVDDIPCLKTVVVKAFVGTPNEIKLLEFILGKASGLEELIISDCMMLDKEDIHRMLSFLPRASSCMQIYVNEDIKIS